MTHPERVYSRAQLLDPVWGDHVFLEERTVDVHIRRLRHALSPTGHEIAGRDGARQRLPLLGRRAAHSPRLTACPGDAPPRLRSPPRRARPDGRTRPTRPSRLPCAERMNPVWVRTLSPSSASSRSARWSCAALSDWTTAFGFATTALALRYVRDAIHLRNLSRWSRQEFGATLPRSSGRVGGALRAALSPRSRDAARASRR